MTHEFTGLSTSPEPCFTPDKIKKVWSTLPQQDLVAAMTKTGLEAPVAENVLRAELGRLLLLGPYHERFYNLPLSLLRDKGILDGSSLNELGPSLFVHFAAMDQRPEAVTGVESKPHIVSAARVAIESFQSHGLLPREYEVIQGDQTVDLTKRDLSILSLVAQYGAAEAGTLNWLMRNGEIGINGDVHHTTTPTTEAEVKTGFLTIKSPTQPSIDVGIAWRLKGQPKSTAFGDIYDATLDISPKVFGEGKNAIHIPVDGDMYTGKVVVYKEANGSLVFQSWTLDPTEEATDEEIAEVLSICITHQDIYKGMSWSSAPAIAIPAYASEKGLYTAMMLTTANDRGLSGTIPLAIVLKNQREAGILHEKGLLSQVGPGKKFENLPLLFERLRFWTQNKDLFNSKFNFTNPHLITTITTANRDVFKRIVG